MFRITFAAGSALLGGLLAYPYAIGQEPLKEDRPAGGPETQAKDFEKLALPADTVFRIAPQFDQFRLYRQSLLTKTTDALETNFGLGLADADDALRAQLEITPGQGVVAVGVKAGSLADQAGLRTNDVLLSLGDQEAKTNDQVRKILLGLGKEALEVKLIREGKATRLSLVGPKHGFPPESTDYWIGVPVSPVDATLRAHLPTLPADSGLVVNDVVKGSPAEQAAVRKNDILVAMGDKPLKDSEALIEQTQATQGKPATLGILRAGKPITITITPAKRATLNATFTVSRPSTVQYRVVRPNMAIEVEPRSPVLPPGQKPGPAKPKGPAKPDESKPTLSWDTTVFPYYGTQAYVLNLATNPYQPVAAEQGLGGQIQLLSNGESPTARVEAQLKEVMAKLEAITKALEGLKKPLER